jgi:hypothetical protein
MYFTVLIILTLLRAESPVHCFALERPLHASSLYCTFDILIKDGAVFFSCFVFSFWEFVLRRVFIELILTVVGFL